MTRESIQETLRKMLEEEMGEDYGALDETARLREDLGLDSMDLVGLISQIEDRFRLMIDSKDLEGLDTVGQILDFIESRVDGEQVARAA